MNPYSKSATDARDQDNPLSGRIDLSGVKVSLYPPPGSGRVGSDRIDRLQPAAHPIDALRASDSRAEVKTTTPTSEEMGVE